MIVQERNGAIDISKAICMMVVVGILTELFAMHDLA